jgi:hypothetical protein
MLLCWHSVSSDWTTHEVALMRVQVAAICQLCRYLILDAHEFTDHAEVPLALRLQAIAPPTLSRGD